MTQYVALIPAYEPDEALLSLLPELKSAGFEIVIVDDGSGEAYTSLFATAATFGEVISYVPNRGKGHALKTGLSYIKNTYPEDSVVVTVDADGQHKVADAVKLCERVLEDPLALWLGSRRLAGKIPLRSRFGNSVTRFVYRISTGLRVHDTQTGLRAFRADMIPEMLQIEGDRYEYEMRVLLEFARKKTRISEMEIETIYLNDNASSHFNPLRDSLRIYKEILKYSAASLLSFLLDYGLYVLFFFLTDRTVLSNVIARVFSGTFNFSVNRKFVFESKGSIWRSALGYILLAMFVLAGNSAVLWLLSDVWQIHALVAKIITEVAFFTLSFTVQHFLVFKKHGGKGSAV